MALADSWPLQQAVFSAITDALSTAAESILVVDHVLTNAPTEHIRLDGFDVRDDSSKNREMGRHPVSITFFRKQTDDQVPVARGQARFHQVNDIIHGAVKDLRLGSGRMQFEMSDIKINDDGVTGRSTLRYTIVI